MSSEAYEVNGISNYDISRAPTPLKVIGKIYKYIEYCAENKVPIIAHNAKFDLIFTLRLVEQYYVIKAPIVYDDTLLNAYRHVSLGSYRLSEVCRAFGVTNNRAHSSYYDALAVGEIYYEMIYSPLLDITRSASEELYKIELRPEKQEMKEDQIEICKIIKQIVFGDNENSYIYFNKTNKGVINLCNPYNYLSFKVRSKKEKYLLIDKNYAIKKGLAYKEAEYFEGNSADLVRYEINDAQSIYDISDYIKESYIKTYYMGLRYKEQSKEHEVQYDMAFNKSNKI